MSETKLRVGICGAGSIIDNHIEALRRQREAEVVGVSSRTLKSAKRAARRYGVKAFADHQTLLNAPDIDAVIVATPNYQHCELTLAAIAAGKHVMVEKPLAMTLAEGRRMNAAARQAGVHLLYAEQLPLAPKFVHLRDLARAGAFGEIYMVRQIERHAGPHSPWFFGKKEAGGGALIDLGCHSLSVVLDIMGDRPIRRVAAVARTFAHTHGDVDDFVLLRLEFAGGAVGVVEANWCHRGGMDSITEVFGSTGNGYADLMKGSGLTTYSERGFGDDPADTRGWRQPRYDTCYECGYQEQARAMVATILHGAPPAQAGDDGVEILRIIAAAYRSAQQGGRPQPLPR